MAAKMRAKKRSKKPERWVVKAGSNMICSGGPMLIRAWMQQVAHLRKRNRIEVIWVTSGAIATAVDFLNEPMKAKRTVTQKQALAAIGQPLVLDLYTMGLRAQGLGAAQVLLTYEDLADGTRRENFQNTIEQLLDWKITPVLNENDAVATQEIRFGDNDSLSARVARAVGADRLVILTDVEGLYDSDPRKNPTARLVPELRSVSAGQIRKLAKESKGGTVRGTGGMLSKLMAAKLASDSGVRTHLVKGDETNVLVELAAGVNVGTTIHSRKKRR
ncbi:MAG: glutamate 5-kinase [Bdellovibrionales bacterium]|nr:glutamate 5-kinase [Bdellovibrionales bacterium]